MFQKVLDGSQVTEVTAAIPLAADAPANASRQESVSAKHIALKVYLHEQLLGMLNLSALDKMTRPELRRELAPLIRSLLNAEGIALNTNEYGQLVDEVLDEVLGLGPLEPFLKDPTVSDILVNTHKQVFVERFGKLEPTTARFKDERHLMRVIQKIVSGVGRRVDESQPWVDARLPDGSRVNALVAPCAVDGALLSIRKFAKIPFTMDRLLEIGSLDRRMAVLFELIVRLRLNILISGGTGSGKRRSLNAMSVTSAARTDYHDRRHGGIATSTNSCRPHGNAATNIENMGR
jgi:pilus assembly protein CpaF